MPQTEKNRWRERLRATSSSVAIDRVKGKCCVALFECENNKTLNVGINMQ